jgi:class 3 adenylate cyclase
MQFPDCHWKGRFDGEACPRLEGRLERKDSHRAAGPPSMKVQARLAALFEQTLTESMSLDQMQKALRRVIPGYEIHQRSGFPPNIPMPRADAAHHVVKVILKEGLFLRFVEALIELTTLGEMGREVKVLLLPRVIAEMEEQGYRYSRQKRMFVEAVGRTRTMGWGTLRDGGSYDFALLRADIVGNSEMVRRYPRDVVSQALTSVRTLVTRLVEKRDGRIWSWEGDGALAAFYFNDKILQATLCGMEIIHELFVYNLVGRPLPEPLRARLAVHAGPCRFLRSSRESAGDTVKHVEVLESSYTPPGFLTVSPNVYTDLGSKLSPLFTAVPGPNHGNVFRYGLEWEQK